MRKDFITATGLESSEASFIEEFWTENWKRDGGVERRSARYFGSFDRFKFKSEWRIMRRYLARLPRGSRLLDGGCGTGEWCRYIGRLGFHVLGMDISRETVAKLQELYPENEFVSGDIRDIDLPGESIDVYYSWGTFEHFEDGMGKCIDEARRVLKPGGLLFITVPFDNLGLALLAVFERAPGRPAAATKRFYQWRFSRRELALELTNRGLEVTQLRPIHRRQTVVRVLHHGLGMDYNHIVTRALGIVIGAVMPRFLCGHMLMAVAKKPGAPERAAA